MPSPSDSLAPPAPGTPAREAVTRLIELYAPQIHALATRVCGSLDEGEDLVQEVFLRALKGWPTFEGRSSVKTWLYTIAVNTCRRMHRTRSGEPSDIGSLHDLLPFGDPLIAAIPGDDESPEQLGIRAEARRRLEEEITRLPDEFRLPLVLKEIAGLSVPEIAQILGLEPGTARSRVHRARLKLRAAIDRALPRLPEPAPPTPYPEQTCLDLLDAKMSALDRGAPFETDVICQRCRSVFASLDLTGRICRELGEGILPEGLRERLLASVAQA